MISKRPGSNDDIMGMFCETNWNWFRDARVFEHAGYPVPILKKYSRPNLHVRFWKVTGWRVNKEIPCELRSSGLLPSE